MHHWSLEWGKVGEKEGFLLNKYHGTGNALLPTPKCY